MKTYFKHLWTPAVEHERCGNQCWFVRVWGITRTIIKFQSLCDAFTNKCQLYLEYYCLLIQREQKNLDAVTLYKPWMQKKVHLLLTLQEKKVEKQTFQQGKCSDWVTLQSFFSEIQMETALNQMLYIYLFADWTFWNESVKKANKTMNLLIEMTIISIISKYSYICV